MIKQQRMSGLQLMNMNRRARRMIGRLNHVKIPGIQDVVKKDSQIKVSDAHDVDTNNGVVNVSDKKVAQNNIEENKRVDPS